MKTCDSPNIYVFALDSSEDFWDLSRLTEGVDHLIKSNRKPDSISNHSLNSASGKAQMEPSFP